MSPSEPTDLTYADFVRLRAQALRNLHVAQTYLAFVEDPRYTKLTVESAAIAQQAVDTAQMLLTQLLDRWNRSKYNRSV